MDKELEKKNTQHKPDKVFLFSDVTDSGVSMKEQDSTEVLTLDGKQKQLEYLIGFIDTFKDTVEQEKIFGMCRFILIALIESPEDREDLFKIIDSLERLEALEKEKALHELGENALLSDVPHTSYKILKEILTDLQGKSPKELKKDASELLEQCYKRPTSLLMPTTKVIQKMFEPGVDLTTRERKINEGSKKKGREIIVIAQILNELPLEPLDREVLNGVFSIIATSEMLDCNPYPLFTITQLIEEVTGTTKPVETQVKAFSESLNRLRTTILNLDWTEYAKKLGLPLTSEEEFKTNDPILMLNEYQFKSGGKITIGYKVASSPVLYTYSKATGRIANIEKPLLKVNVSNTNEAVLIKNYMLRRIKAMYNKHNHIESKVISYESMFNYCRCNAGSYTEMSRRRKTAQKILESWVTMKYIRSYTEIKEGKVKTGLKLQLFENEPSL